MVEISKQEAEEIQNRIDEVLNGEYIAAELRRNRLYIQCCKEEYDCLVPGELTRIMLEEFQLTYGNVTRVDDWGTTDGVMREFTGTVVRIPLRRVEVGEVEKTVTETVVRVGKG